MTYRAWPAWLPLGLWLVLSVLLLASPAATADSTAGTAAWLLGGHDLQNSRYQDLETTIGPANAGALSPQWTFTTHGDISATPAVDAGALFVPGWGGYLLKLDAASGTSIWSHALADYTGSSSTVVSRTSPAIAGGTVYVGTQFTPTGPYLLAIDEQSGTLKWRVKLDDHPYAIDTASPVVQGSRIYVGVSSSEVGATANPSYPCCSFRGSMVAVDSTTGTIVWKTYTVPQGYSGGSIWGSTAAIDLARGLLYTATGDNYTIPQTAVQCLLANPQDPTCIAPDDDIDAVLALDLQTGAIKWVNRMSTSDTWEPGCTCPALHGADADFGSGPNLFTGQAQDLVGVGQKSGSYWVLNRDTGATVWSTQVGPGGGLGGIQWGSATDGSRIYVAEADSESVSYTLNNGQTTSGGSWSALDTATGKILWQTADPAGYLDTGPMTVANGVVYAGSMVAGPGSASPPQPFPTFSSLYAFDAATGTILWSYQTGNSVNAGPAIVNGMVYWGSGYGHDAQHGFGSTSTGTLYAFAPHARPSGQIYVSPSAGSYNAGDSFTAYVVAAAGTAFSAAAAMVNVSSNLSVQRVSAPPAAYGPCNFSSYSVTPTVANPSFAGSYAPGYAASACTVYAMTLTALNGGTGSITINNGTITACSDGSELFGSAIGGSYTLLGGSATATPTGSTTGTPTVTSTSTASATPSSTATASPTGSPTATPGLYAGTGQIYVSPASGTYTAGTSFTAYLVVTAGTSFNAASATVSVSPTLIVQSISPPPAAYGPCNFTYSVTPTAANPSFAGSYGPGFASTACTVYAMTVQVVGGDTGTTTITKGSVQAYGDGSELFGTAGNAAYTLTGGTPTPISTASSTATATASTSPTASATSTATGTATGTATASNTPTATPTDTPTSTSTGTPTASPSSSPTASPTSSPSPTPVPTSTAPSTGTLSFYPYSGSYATGSTFTVTLYAFGNGSTFTVAQATVTLPSNLRGVAVYPGTCNVTYSTAPSAANSSFSGVVPAGTSGCAMYYLTVQAVAAGIGTIAISNASMTRSSDGTDMLKATTDGTYTIT